MITRPFISRSFDVSDTVEHDIDDWLNSISGAGIGTTIMGYVMDQGRVLITVKRWNLADGKTLGYGRAAMPVRTTIDDMNDEPSIQVGEEEVSTTHHG